MNSSVRTRRHASAWITQPRRNNRNTFVLMLRRVRVVIAILFFSLLTLLFLDISGTLPAYLDWTAKIQFFPSVLAMNLLVVVGLLLVTLLFGRIYCSVVCPLGVLQDIFAWFGKKHKKNRYAFSPAKSKLRIGVAIAFALIFIVPTTSVIAYLIEPYSIFGRFASSILKPVYAMCNNVLATIAEKQDSYLFYQTDVWIRSVPTALISILTIGLIGVLAVRGGRTWCNTICPVGTILGYLSKFSLFKITVDKDKCNSCGLCSRNCKSSCIQSKQKEIDYSRCVVCMDCVGKCHKKALSYVPRCRFVPMDSNSSNKADRSKRGFLKALSLFVIGGTIEAKAKKIDGGLAKIAEKKVPERETPIKPAGSLSLKNFATHCTACQLCVAACPNNVLRPSSDLTTFMQPEMSYERGYCRPECNLCSAVCPAGAITKITAAEKSSIQIGRAVVLKENCIAHKMDVSCGNCARHCPVGAILMVKKNKDDPDSTLIPVVDTERCIGCGACEHLCPVRPFSAIYVEGYDIHREN